MVEEVALIVVEAVLPGAMDKLLGVAVMVNPDGVDEEETAKLEEEQAEVSLFFTVKV